MQLIHCKYYKKRCEMVLRQQFIEKKQELLERFDSAINYGNTLNEKYGDVLEIQPIINNLQALQKNWESERFEIVVVGEFSTGKSTFINALLQKEVLPSKVTVTTATVNFIRHLDELPNNNGEPVAVVVFKDQSEKTVPYLELADYVTEMSSKLKVSEEIHHVDLYIESPYLENGVVLVDTPGLQALNPAHEKITKTQIKRSNASILLFNMEQPGKLTEIKFLRDLSDSIDRIFFVANRLDGVPKGEVKEVVEQLEHALKHNDFQQISENNAVVYPVSALQALKARDASVSTISWEEAEASELLSESKFLDFEERLENYLFNGEQTKDLLNVPCSALEKFYAELIQLFEQYQKTIEGSEDLEKLKQDHQAAKDEAEIRNIQLKNEITRLKNQFKEIIRANEKSFNEEFNTLVESTKKSIEEIMLIEDLENLVNDEMEFFNKSYQSLFDSKIIDLSSDLNDSMRSDLNDFEVSIKKENSVSTVKVDIEAKSGTAKSYEQILGEVKQQFESKEQELKLDQQELSEKINLETELRYHQEKRMMKEQEYSEALRYQNQLIQSTPKTLEKHGVIKERKFWFDKKGIVEYDNEKYDEIIAQKNTTIKERNDSNEDLMREAKEIEQKLKNTSANYTTHDEIRNERRALREQKNMAIMQSLNEQLQNTDRKLQVEKRKVLRQLDLILNTTKREYRDFLRELDALKLAEKKIEEYICKQDELLEKALEREVSLFEKVSNSQESRELIAIEIEQIKENIENEKTMLTLAMI